MSLQSGLGWAMGTSLSISEIDRYWRSLDIGHDVASYKSAFVETCILEASFHSPISMDFAGTAPKVDKH